LSTFPEVFLCYIDVWFLTNNLIIGRKISREHMASQEGLSTNGALLFEKEEIDGYVYDINKE
jgi:hypothetical protein